MDRSTLAAYDKDAAAFAKDWHEQPAPTDLQEIVGRFFIHGGATIDVGCGSGREVSWLNDNGYPAIGVDASDGLLAEARTRYPEYKFVHAELPDLADVASDSFDNVLCETVIMHLDPLQIGPAVQRMFSLLKPGGIFYLSWRVSEASQYDAFGRLYAAFDPAMVRAQIAATETLLDEEVISASSGKKIQRLVARKPKI